MWRLGLVLTPLLVSCSLIVDSSINRLRCTQTLVNGQVVRSCAAGYSCRGEECVADNSVEEGDSCTATKQCKATEFCPNVVSICGKPCTKVYEIANDCNDPDMACVPVLDDVATGKYRGGVCISVECNGPTGDDKCKMEPGKVAGVNAANRCIKIAQNGGLCLPACEVSKRSIDDATGRDTCTIDGRGNVQHCGRIASGDFICLPAGAAMDNSRCTLYPQVAGAVMDDACATGAPGLPLVCLNARGSANIAEGELRCRRSACDPATGSMASCPMSPTPQVCAVANSMSYCKGLTE